MTILNYAIAHNEAAILTDSRMSLGDLAADEQATKCLAFPVQQVLMAHCGNAMGEMVEKVHSFLRLGIWGGNVLDLAERFPEGLRQLAAKNPNTSGRVVLIGMIGARCHGFEFTAPQWVAEPLACGNSIMPALTADTTDCGGTIIQQNPTPENLPKPDFREDLRVITAIAPVQVKQNPVTCGGPLILSFIDVAAIRQWRHE